MLGESCYSIKRYGWLFRLKLVFRKNFECVDESGIQPVCLFAIQRMQVIIFQENKDCKISSCGVTYYTNTILTQLVLHNSGFCVSSATKKIFGKYAEHETSERVLNLT